jgi:SAM-dependent methyltransferase
MNRIIFQVFKKRLVGFFRRRFRKVFKDTYNRRLKRNFPQKFRVVDFSLISADSSSNIRWEEWSRIYEYELILSRLEELQALPNSLVHNTCWGFHGVHVKFKDRLDELYPKTLHSDFQASHLPNTATYDITDPPPLEWLGFFDFVLNVSTMEEIEYPQLHVFENLLRMLKPGGFLLATFDIPGLQLIDFEDLFGAEIGVVNTPLSGHSSLVPNHQHADLRVGYFVVERL